MAISLLRTESNAAGVSAQLSVLSKSDGSASWQQSQGSNVLASVNGPIEVRLRDEVLGEANLDLKILPSSGLTGTRERYIENIVRSAVRPSLLLGLHPRSLIQITCQVVSENEDSKDILDVIASAVNSIVMASVDAGLSMSCMLAAAVLRTPDAGSHVVCYSFPAEELIMIESQGPFDRQQLSGVLGEGLTRCATINEYMRDMIQKQVIKDNRWHSQT